MGDLGELAEKLLAGAQGGTLSPAAVQSRLADLVNCPELPTSSRSYWDLFRSLSAVEAKYVIKIITGDLRIGLKETRSKKPLRRPSIALLRYPPRQHGLGDIGEAAILAKRAKWIRSRSACSARQVHARHAGDTEDEIFATFPGPFTSKTNMTASAANCTGPFACRAFTRGRSTTFRINFRRSSRVRGI